MDELPRRDGFFASLRMTKKQAARRGGFLIGKLIVFAGFGPFIPLVAVFFQDFIESKQRLAESLNSLIVETVQGLKEIREQLVIQLGVFIFIYLDPLFRRSEEDILPVAFGLILFHKAV